MHEVYKIINIKYWILSSLIDILVEWIGTGHILSKRKTDPVLKMERVEKRGGIKRRQKRNKQQKANKQKINEENKWKRKTKLW